MNIHSKFLQVLQNKVFEVANDGQLRQLNKTWAWESPVDPSIRNFYFGRSQGTKTPGLTIFG